MDESLLAFIPKLVKLIYKKLCTNLPDALRRGKLRGKFRFLRVQGSRNGASPSVSHRRGDKERSAAPIGESDAAEWPVTRHILAVGLPVTKWRLSEVLAGRRAAR